MVRGRATGSHPKKGRRIDRTAIDDHPEIQMRPVGKATASDGCDPFPAIDRLAALRQKRGDKAEMAINPNEPLMLNQHFQTTYAVPLNPNNPSRSHRRHSAADRRGKIDAIMKRAGQRPIHQNPRPEW